MTIWILLLALALLPSALAAWRFVWGARVQPSTFYFLGVPWCSHCQSARPEWDAFVRAGLPPGISARFVDCEVEPRLEAQFAPPGYPAFYFVTAGLERVPYAGPRTAQGFRDFVAHRGA